MKTDIDNYKDSLINVSLDYFLSGIIAPGMPLNKLIKTYLKWKSVKNWPWVVFLSPIYPKISQKWLKIKQFRQKLIIRTLYAIRTILEWKSAKNYPKVQIFDSPKYKIRSKKLTVFWLVHFFLIHFCNLHGELCKLHM